MFSSTGSDNASLFKVWAIDDERSARKVETILGGYRVDLFNGDRPESSLIDGHAGNKAVQGKPSGILSGTSSHVKADSEII